jgi:hypothetical protein
LFIEISNRSAWSTFPSTGSTWKSRNSAVRFGFDFAPVSVSDTSAAPPACAFKILTRLSGSIVKSRHSPCPYNTPGTLPSRRSWRAAPFPVFSLTVTARSNFITGLRPLLACL